MTEKQSTMQEFSEAPDTVFLVAGNSDDMAAIEASYSTHNDKGSELQLFEVRSTGTNNEIHVCWRVESFEAHIRRLRNNETCDVLVIFPSIADVSLRDKVQWVSIMEGENPEDLYPCKGVWQVTSAVAKQKDLVQKFRCSRFAGENLYITMCLTRLPFELSLRMPTLRWGERTNTFECTEVQAAAKPAFVIQDFGEDRRFQYVIIKAYVQDFSIFVEGLVRDRYRPGIPVRAELLINGLKRAEILARNEIELDTDLNAAAHGSFHFRSRISAKQDEHESDIRLRFCNGELTRQIKAAEALANYYPANTVPSIEIAPNDTIVGNVETTSSRIIRGWAVCKEHPDAVVGLTLLINGVEFAYTESCLFRKDVVEKFGGHGFFGFEFELAPNAVCSRPAKAEVRPIKGINSIKRSKFDLFQAAKYFVPSSRALDLGFTVNPTVALDNSVSVIVLNLNGSSLLRELLQSAADHDHIDRLEWIIVDHGSSDESEQVCADAGARGQNVTFIDRGGNYSFSDSNNFGVLYARSEVVLFANNDLVLRQPISAQIIHALSDSRVGVVGVELLDHVPGRKDNEPLPLQHLGVFFEAQTTNHWVRPYESRRSEEISWRHGDILRVPVVTGAFLAMRRTDFVKIGGFSTSYHYGLEDVDLCLSVAQQLGKHIICLTGNPVVHHRGYSRRADKNSGLRRRENNDAFTTRWSNFLRKSISTGDFTSSAYWVGRRVTIAFAVSDAGDKTSAGEYYTASELGRALQRIAPVHCRYLVEQEWYDLSDVDVIVTMVNRFDLHKVKKASPYLVSINWTRQWFDRWAADPSIYSYDYVWASSETAAAYLRERTGRQVSVVPIASDFNAFSSGHPKKDYICDYCFTGSKFGIGREIEFDLDPDSIDGKGIVFGYNWEGTPFETITAGPVAYSDMPDVYASTSIVIDDANIATKPWGSCNSRVFDTLAAGRLLITNGNIGVEELFGKLVPTYHDKESLTTVLNYWISHPEERIKRSSLLQQIVKQHHTYDNRADMVLNILSGSPRRPRIAIKCAAKRDELQQWGDYHFACSLAVALRSTGYTVRVDAREDWYCGISEADDCVIVLRGLVSYKCKRHQKNIMWLISHPHDVPSSEILSYDHVYVASDLHVDLVQRECYPAAEFLPQCTDVRRFKFEIDPALPRSRRILFVGNSRGHFRETVRWSIEAGFDVEVYGAGWEPFIGKDYVRAKNVPNDVLGSLYANSRYVLCDHWPDMKSLGYVSNRVFDVIAVGGRLICDYVNGLNDLIPWRMDQYASKEELIKILSRDSAESISEARTKSDWVAAHHSFDVRATTISRKIEELLSESRASV